MFGFGTTYTFVSVAFELYGKSYAYRTDDRTIKVNDTVIVPVSGEEKAAVVTDIRKYKKNEVPFPLDKTKFVIKKTSQGNPHRICAYRSTFQRRVSEQRTVDIKSSSLTRDSVTNSERIYPERPI